MRNKNWSWLPDRTDYWKNLGWSGVLKDLLRGVLASGIPSFHMLTLLNRPAGGTKGPLFRFKLRPRVRILPRPARFAWQCDKTRICVCNAVHFQVCDTPVVKRMNLPANLRMSREKTACERNNRNSRTAANVCNACLDIVFIPFQYHE